MRNKKQATSADPSSKAESAKRSPFSLLSVRIAIVLTVLGAGLWAYSLATAPAATPSSQSGGSGGDSGLASGMAPRQSGSSTSTTTIETRPIDSAAPAILRFGMSFLGAFMIGFLLRKFLRWTLLIVAILAIGIYFLRRSGMIDLPWDQIEDGVDTGSTWLQAQAGSIKEFLTGYLPSSVAAVVGGFIGFIRG